MSSEDQNKIESLQRTVSELQSKYATLEIRVLAADANIELLRREMDAIQIHREPPLEASSAPDVVPPVE